MIYSDSFLRTALIMFSFWKIFGLTFLLNLADLFFQKYFLTNSEYLFFPILSMFKMSLNLEMFSL